MAAVDYVEFTRHVNKAGLQLKHFAKLIGVHPPSISKYAGASEVPAKYAILAVVLSEVVDRKLANVADLLATNGFKWPLDHAKVTRLDVYRRSKSKTDEEGK